MVWARSRLLKARESWYWYIVLILPCPGFQHSIPEEPRQTRIAELDAIQEDLSVQRAEEVDETSGDFVASKNGTSPVRIYYRERVFFPFVCFQQLRSPPTVVCGLLACLPFLLTWRIGKLDYVFWAAGNTVEFRLLAGSHLCRTSVARNWSWKEVVHAYHVSWQCCRVYIITARVSSQNLWSNSPTFRSLRKDSASDSSRRARHLRGGVKFAERGRCWSLGHSTIWHAGADSPSLWKICSQRDYSSVRSLPSPRIQEEVLFSCDSFRNTRPDETKGAQPDIIKSCECVVSQHNACRG